MTAPKTARQPYAADLVALASAMGPNRRRYLHDITWNEYQQLSAAFPDSAKVRLAYHEGTLEIMTLGYLHEHQTDSLLRLVSTIALEMEIDLESIGSATMAKDDTEDAAEPDAAFYITHAQQMIGCKVMDLERNPPPDIVVEVDVTHPSLNKRAIYAQFGVPELWHLARTKVAIYELQNGSYQPREHSLAFPFLNSQVLGEFLDECVIEGQSRALRNFRERFKNELRPTP